MSSQSSRRRSRVSSDGTRLLHGDLHNHSLHSDGRGDPERAFGQMRAAGLDVAALTDHASIPHDALHTLHLGQYPDAFSLAVARSAPRSFDRAAWDRTARLADAHDVPGEFTALRGFEWTEPWLGHVNVWFSTDYLPVTTPGSLLGLEEWLTHEQPQALYGYNHPGREPGRLAEFARPGLDPEHASALERRMVSIEAFNRQWDFLFAGDDPHFSPIATILDLGWRPGLIGCSDEHGRSYGLAGKGRTGLWALEHSREGVREALEARRVFATREVGLRLDATLDGVRMGSSLPGALAGRHELRVDLAGGSYDGVDVRLQLLTGNGSGTVLACADVPAMGGEVTSLSVDIGPSRQWLLLRVADPAHHNDTPGPDGHPANFWGVAYASPWWPGDSAGEDDPVAGLGISREGSGER